MHSHENSVQVVRSRTRPADAPGTSPEIHGDPNRTAGLVNGYCRQVTSRFCACARASIDKPIGPGQHCGFPPSIRAGDFCIPATSLNARTAPQAYQPAISRRVRHRVPVNTPDLGSRTTHRRRAAMDGARTHARRRALTCAAAARRGSTTGPLARRSFVPRVGPGFNHADTADLADVDARTDVIAAARARRVISREPATRRAPHSRDSARGAKSSRHPRFPAAPMQVST
jgi:hypothetical protein